MDKIDEPQVASAPPNRLNLLDLTDKQAPSTAAPSGGKDIWKILDGFVVSDSSNVQNFLRYNTTADLRKACIDAIPADQYREFVKAGYEVKVVKDIDEYDKLMKTNFAGTKPEGYPDGWTWRNVDTFFDPTRKKIVVCQNFIPQGTSDEVPTENAVDLPKRFRHEFGHALDAVRNYAMEDDKQLQKLYAQEVAALKHSPVTAQALQYYLQPGEAGLRETIAGLYSVEHGGGTDQGYVEQSLKSAFAPMLKYMQEHKF